jgi:hypothetical protein
VLQRCEEARRRGPLPFGRRCTSLASKPANLDEAISDAVGEMCPHPAPDMNLRRERLGPERGVAKMARFGVRSGSVAFARSAEDPAIKRFERTGAHRSERSLALAMQKVEASSSFIRSSGTRWKRRVFRCAFEKAGSGVRPLARGGSYSVEPPSSSQVSTAAVPADVRSASSSLAAA